MLHLIKIKQVAVKHAFSVRDQMPWRLVFESFLFHPFTPVREIDLLLWRAFGIKLRFGDRFVHGKPIRQKKMRFKTYGYVCMGPYFNFLLFFVQEKVPLLLPKLKKSTK